MEDNMSLNMIDEKTTAQTDDWAKAEDDEALARFGISPNQLSGKEEESEETTTVVLTASENSDLFSNITVAAMMTKNIFDTAV